MAFIWRKLQCQTIPRVRIKEGVGAAVRRAKEGNISDQARKIKPASTSSAGAERGLLAIVFEPSGWEPRAPATQAKAKGGGRAVRLVLVKNMAPPSGEAPNQERRVIAVDHSPVRRLRRAELRARCQG
jgi:hypothetical protein